MTRTRIKMCGMTSVRDIELAVEAGADAVGIILAPSPRRVDPSRLPELLQAVPPLVEAVAVLVDPSDADARPPRELGCTLQFSGNEDGADCERIAAGRPYIKAFHVAGTEANIATAGLGFENAIWMFDSRVAGSYGGTGTPFVWDAVEPIARARRVVVSGGLTPDNVARCVRRVRPFAVDVRSGVETDDAKDFEKMCSFVRIVRALDGA